MELLKGPSVRRVRATVPVTPCLLDNGQFKFLSASEGSAICLSTRPCEAGSAAGSPLRKFCCFQLCQCSGATGPFLEVSCQSWALRHSPGSGHSSSVSSASLTCSRQTHPCLLFLCWLLVVTAACGLCRSAPVKQCCLLSETCF